MELLDKLIERGKSILPSKKDDKTPQAEAPALKAVIDDLIQYGESHSFDDWEMEIATRLRREVPRYSWVGMYWVRGDELHLGAWSGPAVTEHTRIPIGDGICGLAVRTKQTELVDDVDSHPDYLACFPSTRSEVVVPILQGMDAIGEIDIDGDQPGALGKEDVAELERLAAAISRKLDMPHPG